MENKQLSLKDWLKLKRNNGCPLHGYHISKSLTRYTGYCKLCNQFWRFRRAIEMKHIPYWWYYFNPDNPKERIGKCYSGRG